MWSKVQQKAFEDVKKSIVNAPTLRYFDNKADCVLQTDMSDAGVGAVLLQKGQPISFASRTWKAEEKNYAPIEREMKAVVYGLQKFHDYCYARRVTVHCDHRPLESIGKKPLQKVPHRIRKMLTGVRGYDFEIVCKRKPGSQVVIADALSRNPLPEQSNEEKDDVIDVDTINAIEFLAMNEDQMSELVKATEADGVSQVLIDLIQTGFPDDATDIPDEAKPYFKYRKELQAQEGLLFRGERVIIPKTLRSK